MNAWERMLEADGDVRSARERIKQKLVRLARRIDLGTTSATAAVLALILLALWGSIGGSTASVLHPTTGCPIGVPPERQIVILVDTTDVLSNQQRAAIIDDIDKRLRNLGRGDRLDLAEISDTSGVLWHPDLTRCSGARGHQVWSLNRSKSRTERKWNEEFLATVLTRVEELFDKPESRTSPIFEALIRTAKEMDPDAGEHRLVVYSDWLQNSSLLSVYRGGGHALARIDRREIDRFVGAVRDVSLEAGRFPQTADPRRERIIGDFWNPLFEMAGIEALPYM